jgi:sugar/nucleoside kinase (ribokinase family)
MTVRATGRRTFFHQRGANACLVPGHFDFTRTRCRHFHLGYLLLLDELDRRENGVPRAAGVLRRARAAGLTTSVDLVSENSDRFGAVVRPVLPEVDVLFANDFEAERLTGRPLRPEGRIDRARVEQAALELLDQGVREWVVLHFAEGACAVGTRRERHWQPSLALPPEAIRGTAGAGDAFASGVLYARHSGQGIAEALRLGVCVAAGSLTHPTCSEGILPANQSMRLDERWGYRTIPA